MCGCIISVLGGFVGGVVVRWKSWGYDGEGCWGLGGAGCGLCLWLFDYNRLIFRIILRFDAQRLRFSLQIIQLD